MSELCDHLKAGGDTPASTPGCQQCLQQGDTWVQLRRCVDCGHVGCCDSSKNKHATKHYYRSKHPVIQSFQPGEGWRWCYVDEIMAE